MNCSICGKPFDGLGNNAKPINDGRCCDACDNIVTAQRITDVTGGDPVIMREMLDKGDEMLKEIHMRPITDPVKRALASIIVIEILQGLGLPDEILDRVALEIRKANDDRRADHSSRIHRS